MAGELLSLAEQVVGRAQPGEQVEAFVARGTETEVKVYGGSVEEFTSAQSEGIGIRVIRGGRTGFAYAATLDASALAEVLADARDNLGFGSVDEWAGLAEPDGVAVTPAVLWDDALAATPTADKIALALDLERQTLALDPRVRLHDSNYADGAGEVAIATSTGIRSTHRSNSCFVSVSTLADDRGQTQTGFGFAVGRNPGELDIARAAADGVHRATRLLGAVKPSSRRLSIVLDPYVAAQFIGILASTLNGESVLKGRSLFANRLGEQVAAPFFTMIDDPTNPLAYTACETDGEGLAARRNVLVDQGVLRQFVQSSYSGRRSATASTGNGVRGGFAGTPGCGCLAIQVTPGTRTPTEIISGIDEGVLIQQVSGLHSGVNAVSGDFSTGAAGLMIRNGELAEPVKEFTIASTIQRMLLDVIELGNDLDWLPMRATGLTMAVSDVTMSGA